MTMQKILIKNLTKKRHLNIYHRHQNRRVDQVFHVDRSLVEQVIPNEARDMKFLFGQLSKVNRKMKPSDKINSRVPSTIQGT